MIIISYVTLNTSYVDVLNEKLLPSLIKWNLAHEIVYIESKGSWAANTAMKSQIIKDMLLKYRQPICFIDADATIEHYPTLLFNIPQEYDISFHYLNWYGHWRNDWNNLSRMELLSGTMIWNYNEKTLALLDTWIEQVNKNINIWEQKVLEQIVKSKSDLKIYPLPAEYCCVVKADYTIPSYIKEPIIIHWQASREYKRRKL